MSIFKKQKIDRRISNDVNFYYSLGGMTLSFKVDIENKQNLKDFKKLLSAGAEDIERCIKKVKWQDWPEDDEDELLEEIEEVA